MSRLIRPLRLALAAALLLGSLGARAALFEDEEARRAILDLRQRLEAVQRRQGDEGQRAADALGRAAEENAQLRRSVLELSNQIEQLRADLSRQVGQSEQLARELAEVQRRLKDVNSSLEDRLRRMEPAKVSVDGREFEAEPAETRDYQAALAALRSGDFALAQTSFGAFLNRYPSTGYKASAQFWLGNAQYAARNHREAVATLRAMLAAAPEHPRAPEALLAVANAQLELKEPRPAVRKTLEELLKAYPQSEAAGVAKDRLAKLK